MNEEPMRAIGDSLVIKTGVVPASLRFPAVGEKQASNALTHVHICAHVCIHTHTHGAADWGRPGGGRAGNPGWLTRVTPEKGLPACC